MASIIIRSLMTRCLCIVMLNIFLPITAIALSVETTLMMVTQRFIRKDVTLAMPVATNSITTYNPLWAFTIGVGLADPAPVINRLIRLHIIVALTLSRVLYGLSVCGCTIGSICIPTIDLLVDGVGIVITAYYGIICTDSLSVLMLSILICTELMVVLTALRIGRKSHT